MGDMIMQSVLGGIPPVVGGAHLLFPCAVCSGLYDICSGQDCGVGVETGVGVGRR